MTKYSLIQLKIQTKEHLKKIGTKGQTYDEVITQLIRNKIKIAIYTMYIQLYSNMVRRMKAIITQIESVVTPSGNSGHVVVPKAWIGKEAIVTLKENRTKGKK
jgi:putative transposon-encoded protein